MNIMDRAVAEYCEKKADTYIGIFGNPIKHTLSPVIHDTLSELLNVNEKYIPFHIEDDLEAWVKQAYKDGILGLNITVPYKQEVMKSLVDCDDAAMKIGAVNTLVRTENGYKGYNTDMPGLARAMKSEGFLLENKKVIMLGAGGAARAVAYMCMKYRAKKVYIVNRTYSNAENLCNDMNSFAGENIFIAISSDQYMKIPLDRYTFIQCTSVGLREEDSLPLVNDIEFYDMAENAVDLIYNPAETPFLKLMREKSVPYMNGLKMLLYQGIMAYELWNEVSINETQAAIVYDRLCEKLYGKKDNIVLIGYMGCGKSSVGRYISKNYGYDFLDTDMYIEEKAGMSIPEIFEHFGESYFRDLETEILKELREKFRHTVIATGGGLPLRKENADILKLIGKVYYLKADADITYSRIKDSKNRPLLNCENPYNKICSMLEERMPLYERAANEVITETENMTLHDVAELILKRNS